VQIFNPITSYQRITYHLHFHFASFFIVNNSSGVANNRLAVVTNSRFVVNNGYSAANNSGTVVTNGGPVLTNRCSVGSNHYAVVTNRGTVITNRPAVAANQSVVPGFYAAAALFCQFLSSFHTSIPNSPTIFPNRKIAKH
jgi:hypothetical protein